MRADQKKNILGEVFVLDDGGEVDLDLGNYERYLDVTLTRENNITTGKIYQQVIEREVRQLFFFCALEDKTRWRMGTRADRDCLRAETWRLPWKDGTGHSPRDGCYPGLGGACFSNPC